MSSSAQPPHESRTQWIIFLLTLALHASAALEYTHRYPDEPRNDESRYFAYAQNIVLGSYVPADNPDFVNGPGYPAVLVPFVAWHIPVLWARLLNSLFVALAAVLLYRIVRRMASRGWAIVAAAWVALHIDVLVNAREAVTEAPALLLIVAVAGSLCSALRTSGRRGWWACVGCGVLLAALAMTRVIFGHVIATMVLGSLIMLPFWRRGRQSLVKTLCVSVVAFALCLPYLAYTKETTGKNYCWSTNSGELLFWLTRTHPGHNGCWYSYTVAMTDPVLAPLYRAYFSRVTQLPALEREHDFSEEAVKGLKTAPRSRLAYNWMCNVSRLLFAFPTALTEEGLTFVAAAVFNVPFVLMVGLAGVLALKHRNRIPPEVLILFAIALIYTGGSTLATARSRYFVVITPMFWVAASAVLQRSVRIQLLPGTEDAQENAVGSSIG